MQLDTEWSWLRAALLPLLHTPQLVSYCLSDHCDADALPKRINACIVASEFRDLVRCRWGQAPGTFSGSRLLDALGRLSKPFSRPRPTLGVKTTVDAILDALHAAWAKTPRIKSPAVCALAGSEMLRLWDFDTYSIVPEIFQGIIDGAVVPRGVSAAVTGTGTLLKAVTLAPAAWLPLVLLVELPRIRGRSKSDVLVEYPLHFVAPQNGENARYDLYAVIVHRGDASTGTYHAMCREIDAWVTHDAEGRCVPVEDVEDVVTNDAVLLWYKKDLG